MLYRSNRYRRRPVARKGPRRPYRQVKRLAYRKRPLMKAYKSIMSFKRTVQLDNINYAAATQNLVYTFSLGQLPNSTEFTNLYDAYKIKCVVLKFVPMATSGDVNPIGTYYPVPPLHSVIDTSDQTSLSLFTDYLQYSTYKMSRGLQTHTRKVYPKVLDTLDDNGVATVAGIKSSWIRTESPNIDHLGVKVHVPASLTGVNSGAVYQVFATYYVQLKNTK